VCFFFLSCETLSLWQLLWLAVVPGTLAATPSSSSSTPVTKYWPSTTSTTPPQSPYPESRSSPEIWQRTFPLSRYRASTVLSSISNTKSQLGLLHGPRKMMFVVFSLLISISRFYFFDFLSLYWVCVIFEFFTEPVNCGGPHLLVKEKVLWCALFHSLVNTKQTDGDKFELCWSVFHDNLELNVCFTISATSTHCTFDVMWFVFNCDLLYCFPWFQFY